MGGTALGNRTRAILRCTECESTHTGYTWPDDPPKVVGRENCPSCGASEFEVIEDVALEESDADAGS